MMSQSTRNAGYWSAIFASFLSVAYVVAQLAEWQGLLGSAGGSESSSAVLGIVLLLTPSFFLAPVFLVLIVSIHQVTPADRKIWSHAAIASATIYTALVCTVYYVQLALVAPRMARGQIGGLEPFLFVPFDSFLYAVDILGYSFMSVATLLAARVFPGAGLSRIVRLFLTANGILLPFLLLQMYFHSLLWFASLWAITFPASTIALAFYFQKSGSSRQPEIAVVSR
jgi:hypothetical protein